MIPSGWHRAGLRRSKTTSHMQVTVRYEDRNGGRYRIRTCDFHRVNLIEIGFSTTYKYVEVA